MATLVPNPLHAYLHAMLRKLLSDTGLLNSVADIHCDLRGTWVTFDRRSISRSEFLTLCQSDLFFEVEVESGKMWFRFRG